ncbi:EAL domain-containing protein [Ornithinibacillus sp. L9]|uniref:EAL domain-containing protein n=1 Tax=Ornithinibacillus caprae TaxID=2678566 RepID=A0A6N8FMM5_9BACI|nr:EAL domain-containing protein [Ornithinibacillus caprae]MUK88999.1 EAL domain-containing protein [Ornithinibacillus caprae]
MSGFSPNNNRDKITNKTSNLAPGEVSKKKTEGTDLISLEIAQQAGKLGVWEYDIVQDQSYLSKQLLELAGIDPNANFTPCLQKALDFIHSDDRNVYKNIVMKSINNKEHFSKELRIIRVDGKVIHAYVQAQLVFDENNNPIRMVGIVKDITSMKQMEHELQETESKFQHLADNLQAGIWTFDAKNSEYWTSKGIEKITGYIPNDFNSNFTWDSIVHPDDKSLYSSQQSRLQQGINLFHQYRIVHKNGDPVWVQDQTLPVLDRHGNLIRLNGIITDISDQKVCDEKIKRLAYHDHLTDLPTRSLLSQKIEALMKAYRQTPHEFSLMYVNIDRFKSINNTLGYHIGDKLLKQICKRINSFLSNNEMLARISGDEFAVLLSNYDQPDYPITIAKTIIDGFHEPFIVDDYELHLTTSVGISTFPHNGESVEELLQNANTALSRAKKLGKDTYQIYSPSLNIDSFKQYYLERDLRKSIENNELQIYFQPRVEASTGKIVSAEALIRWEHPVWGMVSPGEFIPLAEETGFVNEIGDWVLKEVCRFLKEWEKDNLSIVPISINITAQRFLKSNWKEMYTTILEDTGTDPALIELEITETTIIQYEKPVEDALIYLKELGIRIALDDFGTGYSSLSYIHKFPIDTIKIDQSFTRQITKSDDVEVIIKSIIFMAKGLKLNVVAEGVETFEQLAFYRNQDCSEIQGYLYSKPVPKKDFRSLLKRQMLKISFDESTQLSKNRRKHFRIPLTFPIAASMTLSTMNGKNVNIGKNDVLIEDIGASGLKFLANIHLPVRYDILYEFETTIMNKKITLYGKIVRKEEIKGVFSYGVEFIFDGPERDNFINTLNQFSVQLRKNPFVPNSNIIRDDRFTYLKKRKNQTVIEQIISL